MVGDEVIATIGVMVGDGVSVGIRDSLVGGDEGIAPVQATRGKITNHKLALLPSEKMMSFRTLSYLLCQLDNRIRHTTDLQKLPDSTSYSGQNSDMLVPIHSIMLSFSKRLYRIHRTILEAQPDELQPIARRQRERRFGEWYTFSRFRHLRLRLDMNQYAACMHII